MSTSIAAGVDDLPLFLVRETQTSMIPIYSTTVLYDDSCLTVKVHIN